jgi:hypothetical protein
MIDRCRIGGSRERIHHAGRGIMVCDFLAESPANLLAIIGPKPLAGASLDREKNDLGYWCGGCVQCITNKWPLNVRWADSFTQAANRRTAILLTHEGVTLCLSEWARRKGKSWGTIKTRLDRGWSVADALDVPVDATRGVGYAAYQAGGRRKVRVKRKQQPPRTHGMRNRPEYKNWRSIKERCLNPNNRRYSQYSRLGICSGLRDSFAHFFAILGPRPEGKRSVDRIKGHLGYHCGACDDCLASSRVLNIRWADSMTQGRNKMNVRLITYRGETRTAREWSEANGIPLGTIADRIRRGWEPERAVSVPTRRGPS